MAVVRFDPFRGFEGMMKKMNNFMNDFDKGVSLEYGSFVPKIDISEDEKQLFIQAELPGIQKNDVKVKINNDNVLTISGEKKVEDKFKENKENYTFIRAERSYGNFTRSFMLPENVNTDSINAKFENGILNVTLDKIEPEKPKEINIDIQ